MRIRRTYILLLSFLLPLAVMVVTMAVCQVGPFGDHSFLIIDGLHQYMPFYSVLYDKLKEGENLFYSFRAGLGINFLSLFSYYLSSPFNLLILFFQKTQLNTAVSLLVVLKIALCGLTAGIYFSGSERSFAGRHGSRRVGTAAGTANLRAAAEGQAGPTAGGKDRKVDVAVLLCAVAYALNGYMTGYCWNVMWLDAVMILPVVLLGIERLIDKKDGRLYATALFYALYCNYYIAFMICIFAVIWYLFYSFCSFRQFFFRGIAFAFYSLLAAGMAAVLLIPAYLGIKQTASGAAMGLPEHGWQTGIADLLTRQFDMIHPVSHDNFDGNANLYTGVFMVFAVTLYLLNREIGIWDKMKKVLLIAFFYVSFSENILNFIWHGFHNQYGIPNRFSFLFGFVLIVMLYEVLQHRDGVRNWHVVLGCLTGAGLLAVSRQWAEEPLEDGMYGLAGMLILAYGLILFVMSFDRRRRKWHAAVFCLVAATELCVTSVLGFQHVGQISVSKFFSGTEDMEKATQALDDGTFYRSELADGKMVDENAWYDLNAVGLFGSTAIGDMVVMMDALGFYTGANEYLYEGATPVTNYLLDVRYQYFHPEDGLRTEFTYKDSFGDFRVYENPAQGMSIGYRINDSIDEWFYESAYPFRVQNELCALGYGVFEIFDNLDIPDPEVSGCTASRTNDGEYYFEYETSQQENMVFTIPMEKNMKDLYIFYDGTQVENAEIAVDGSIVRQGDLDSRMIALGNVSKGSVLTVRFKLKGETENGYVRLSAADFNTALFEGLTEKMSSRAFDADAIRPGYVDGSVTAEEGEKLFFSIPYDAGWDVLVDGEPVQAEKIGNAFLAVGLTPGEHEVTLTFTPSGFALGWKISLLSVGIFAAVCVLTPVIRRKRREKDAAVHCKNREIPADAVSDQSCYNQTELWEQTSGSGDSRFDGKTDSEEE